VKIRVKIIRTVQCCIVYHNCTQLQAHTCEQLPVIYIYSIIFST